MSDSSAQRVRVGPFAVSVDKQKPLIGAKISKVRAGPVDERARATRLFLAPRTPPSRDRDRLDDRLRLFARTRACRETAPSSSSRRRGGRNRFSCRFETSRRGSSENVASH